MNAQERTLLTQFLDQLAAARAEAKDADADRLIREACARQPDAAYLLVQRALQLEQALDVSQAEVARLQREVSQPRGDAGFLSQANAWGRAPAQPATSATQTPTGRPVGAPPAMNGMNAMPANAAPRQRFGGGSNLLGTVAATAAGVVAGSFLFQGVQNLLNGHEQQAAAAEPVAPLADAAPAEDLSFDPDFGNAGWDDGGGGDFA